jgi:hypothetical protein
MNSPRWRLGCQQSPSLETGYKSVSHSCRFMVGGCLLDNANRSSAVLNFICPRRHLKVLKSRMIQNFAAEEQTFLNQYLQYQAIGCVLQGLALLMTIRTHSSSFQDFGVLQASDGEPQIY